MTVFAATSIIPPNARTLTFHAPPPALTSKADYISDGLRRAGFICLRAADGEEGLAAILHGRYDAAAMDIMLPRLDGLEVIRRARAVGVRTPIIERMWDYAFDPHTNVVEACVSRLRGKITAPGERELIHTARRFGHVLEAR